MLDKYASFEELARSEIAERDYRVQAIERRSSAVLIVAPHGGGIEIGTSELAALIAGNDHSLFTFEGLKTRGHNRDLHVTSHNFDHPACLALAARSAVTLGVHGCSGDSRIYLGGLDRDLVQLLARGLSGAGLPVSTEGHKYPGRNPLNICNRSRRGRGAQLEITRDLRDPPGRAMIAPVVRRALAAYQSMLGAAAG